MARRTPLHARTSDASLTGGVEGNARLTSSVAAVLFLLLFAEGVTILQIGGLISTHVFIGVLLLPPLLLKIGSTSWRFVRYYTGNPAYLRKGPPAPLLRLFGPLIVVLSLAVMASGVALVIGAPPSWRTQLLGIHKVTFVLWFLVTAVHVLGHLPETLKLAPRDWVRPTRRQVQGASVRQWLLVAGLAIGLICAVWITPYAVGWRTAFTH
ncbi:MAG: hypothetical protein HKL86_08495 [Acidimicrobiaceae bacterium]|nr:hypothetical protein [Acidimicrobiaceae bacterium]